MAAPAAGRARPAGPIPRASVHDASIVEYYERLQARVGDAGDGRYLPLAEDALLEEHNRFRSGQRLRPLARHAALDLAARAHAADLIQRNYFAHEAPEGFSVVERVGLLARQFIGLAGENLVEVVGGPPASAEDLARLWRASPGHRANMLRPGYSHVGFGVARRGDRSVAAAAFGETFAELPAPMAFRVGGVGRVGQSMIGQGMGGQGMGIGSPVRGFALQPVDGGRPLGPFWLEDPAPSIEVSGGYAIKPYVSDPDMRGRYIIVDGPIIEAEA